jgi:hypothetical protein
MPAHFLPGKRFEIQLDCDKDTPNVFYFRVLTGADIIELAGLNDTLKSLGDGKRVIVAIYDAIRAHLTGWNLSDAEGNAVEYEPARLIDYLSLGEAKELIEKLIGSMRVSEDERGK